MEEYELVSIELYDSNPNFYRISEGYVYFAQQLEICYRDKKYKDKVIYVFSYFDKEDYFLDSFRI